MCEIIHTVLIKLYIMLTKYRCRTLNNTEKKHSSYIKFAKKLRTYSTVSFDGLHIGGFSVDLELILFTKKQLFVVGT